MTMNTDIDEGTVDAAGLAELRTLARLLVRRTRRLERENVKLLEHMELQAAATEDTARSCGELRRHMGELAELTRDSLGFSLKQNGVTR